MVPPHEECSEAMAAALARTGFAAISMTRPFPWLSPPPQHWLTAARESRALAGWQPADLTASGLPVLLRHPFADAHFSPAELALRAYLDQPLILYGHHDDLADGLDVLAERSAAVNRLGDVRWGSLESLASANVRWRLEGDLLRLSPYTRQVTFEVPAEAKQVVVEPPWNADGEVGSDPKRRGSRRGAVRGLRARTARSAPRAPQRGRPPERLGPAAPPQAAPPAPRRRDPRPRRASPPPPLISHFARRKIAFCNSSLASGADQKVNRVGEGLAPRALRAELDQ